MKTSGKVAQIGLDSHRKFGKATALDAEGQVVWRRRLEYVNRPALLEQLREWPASTPVVLEATFGWGWLSDELSFCGLEPHLSHSRKVAAWRVARGIAKSNRTDADLLAELWSQQPPWWEVWLAPAEVRDQREWLRYRMTLVRLQTGLKNRIHAVLHRHGIVQEFSDLFGKAGREFLQHLVEPDDGTLRESAKGVLGGYLKLLAQLRQQIAQVTRQFRRQLVKSAAGRRMRSLPGINWILAYTILAEIGRIERFASARHLASYSVLAPRANDSGDEPEGTPTGRHIGHAGRRTLKWAWIEGAHGAVRAGGRFRAIFDRITDGGQRNRNRGYIAVAHELCRVAYTLWKKDIDWSEVPPPRPGSDRRGSKRRRQRIREQKRARREAASRRREESRPGTGQPEHPMVGAVE
jgi:transposase